MCDKSDKTCGVNLNIDVNNCGGCGKICGKSVVIANATAYKCDGRECRVTECGDGYFPSYDRTMCEKTGDVENCGAMNYSCKYRVKGWSEGVCRDNTCVATQCESKGYLLNENGMCLYTACAVDSECSGATNACDKGVCICSSANGIVCSGSQPYCDNKVGCAQCLKNEHCVAENAAGICQDGKCKFTCPKGYYSVMNGDAFVKCEINSDSHCGNVDTDCRQNNDNRHCNVFEGKCVECTDNDHCRAGVCTTEGKCQIIQCPWNMHFYDGICEENSKEHCGGHDVKCDKKKIDGADKVACQYGECVATKCKQGYWLSINKCVRYGY